MSFRQDILRNLINIPGWRTNRKIVVLESDDWGSIRMPSLDVYNTLLAEGYQVNRDPYLKFDSIETNEDIEMLLTTLDSVRDKNGNGAVLTANYVVANPDFEKIEKMCFASYAYEPFTETLKRNRESDRVMELLRSGMERGLIRPQFHGREHLNVFQWMTGLQSGDNLLHKAFENRMISISSEPSTLKYAYMEGLDFFSEEELVQKHQILTSGAALFRDIFGYQSESFIANCYIWHPDIEKTLSDNGVRYMQGIPNQLIPTINNGHHFIYRKHYTGQKNRWGQRYIIRNVFFEPAASGYNQAETLNRIKTAFRWGKPAVIGSHRLNYMGSINPENRNLNLKYLKELLCQIVRIWPDVEFMSTDQVGGLMSIKQ